MSLQVIQNLLKLHHKNIKFYLEGLLGFFIEYLEIISFKK